LKSAYVLGIGKFSEPTRGNPRILEILVRMKSSKEEVPREDDVGFLGAIACLIFV